jgi:SAM-dependent methyltransferase
MREGLGDHCIYSASRICLLATLGRVRQAVRRPEAYEPSTYWERRSRELIDAYDHPETWIQRDWSIATSPEERVVPELLDLFEVRSVLVAGAGSGRQYEYLEPLGLDEIRGFDLSPTMVAECTRRYPHVPTIIDDVIGCHMHERSADAVLAVTVLQHVRPPEIAAALDSLRRLAGKLLIVLELTEYSGHNSYVFAHDYLSLMRDWRLVSHEDVRARPNERTELLTWAPATLMPDHSLAAS